MQPARDKRLIFLFFSLFILTTIMILLYRQYSMDDSYITFRYAWNICHGNGFVFNPGERVQGTTTPLYALLMAGVLCLVKEPQFISLILSGLFYSVAAVFFYLMSRAYLSPTAAMVSASLLPALPLITRSYTMETGLYVSLIVAVFYWKEQGRMTLAAFCAALAFLTRFDGILLAPFALLQWKNKRISLSPARAWTVYAIPVLLWLGFAWSYFGTVLPHTFSKKEQFSMDVFHHSKFIKGVLTWSKVCFAHNNVTILGILGALCLIGIVLACAKQWIFVEMTLWMTLYFSGYFLINPPWEFDWYYVPLISIIWLLSASLFPLHFEIAGASPKRTFASVARACLYVLLVSIICYQSIRYHRKTSPAYPRSHVRFYKKVSQYLQDHAAKDATIACAEVGVIGFYSHRRIIDLAGLISPEVEAKIKGSKWRTAVHQTISQTMPDYMALNVDAGWCAELRSDTQVMSRYKKIFTGHKGRYQLVLFKKVDKEGPQSLTRKLP